MKKIVIIHFDYPADYLLAYRGYLGYHKMSLMSYLLTVMLNFDSHIGIFLVLLQYSDASPVGYSQTRDMRKLSIDNTHLYRVVYHRPSSVVLKSTFQWSIRPSVVLVVSTSQWSIIPLVILVLTSKWSIRP